MSSLVEDASRAGRLAPAQSAYRTLMVHVQPDAAAQARLAAAAALAHSLDADLWGVGAEMMQPIAFADPMGGSDAIWMIELQQQVRDNLRRAEACFRAAATGLRAEWTSVEDIPVTALARLSRGADLIVAGGSTARESDRYRWCDPAELILLSGRPVLVTPPKGGKLAAEAVVVAWKDSREARRAVADALPFLKSAREVLVVEVCDRDAFADAEGRLFSLIQGLKRHGIEARAKVTAAPPSHVAEELEKAASSIGADLIVAGGYGHSRLGEWVFGGATRDLLELSGRFLLMSH